MKTAVKQIRKIAITGGKGGIGKSTVSTLLAYKLKKQGKKVILVDCDVECPNDYLLLGRKLKNSVKKVYAQFPKLNKDKCLKCGLCVRNCRSNAIFQAPGEYPVFVHKLCSGCGLCWHLCPHKAIEIERKVIGEVFENKIDSRLFLVTGQSIGIVNESGPVVTKTKEYALDLAQKIKADYILFDTSVGLHCGVIRALIDCHLAYAVTEPTPLGAHDLKLILNLLKILKIPAKIIINQENLGKRKLIEEIAQKTKTVIAYRIPYSKELVKKYSGGRMGEVNIL